MAPRESEPSSGPLEPAGDPVPDAPASGSFTYYLRQWLAELETLELDEYEPFDPIRPDETHA